MYKIIVRHPQAITQAFNSRTRFSHSTERTRKRTTTTKHCYANGKHNSRAYPLTPTPTPPAPSRPFRVFIDMQSVPPCVRQQHRGPKLISASSTRRWARRWALFYLMSVRRGGRPGRKVVDKTTLRSVVMRTVSCVWMWVLVCVCV